VVSPDQSGCLKMAFEDATVHGHEMKVGSNPWSEGVSVRCLTKDDILFPIGQPFTTCTQH
jgi:hypothetical protein